MTEATSATARGPALLEPAVPPTRTTLAALWLLTAAAGAADALCFLVLGKIFSSFMSGNFLFLGIGAGTGDWSLAARAALSLACFFVGAVLGTVMVSRTPRTGRPSHYNLLVELPLLVAGGLIYVLVADPRSPVASSVIIALFAAAMGVQASAVLDLNLPGVLTNALTATWVVLARSVGRGMAGKPGLVYGGRPYLVAQCACYGVSALAVAAVVQWRGAGFAPALVVGVVLAVVLVERRRDVRRGSATPAAPAA